MGQSAVKEPNIGDIFHKFGLSLPIIGVELTYDEIWDLVESLLINMDIRNIGKLPVGKLDQIPAKEIERKDKLVVSYGHSSDRIYESYFISRVATNSWYVLRMAGLLPFEGHRNLILINRVYCNELNCVLDLLRDALTYGPRELSINGSYLYSNLSSQPIYRDDIDGSNRPDKDPLNFDNSSSLENYLKHSRRERYTFDDYLDGKNLIYNENGEPKAEVTYYFNGKVASLISMINPEEERTLTEIYATDGKKLFQYETIKGLKHGPEYRWFLGEDPTMFWSIRYWWFGKLDNSDEYRELLNKTIQEKTNLISSLSGLTLGYHDFQSTFPTKSAKSN